ncbi:TPA: 4-demethylwyosine synthase TYW1 [Candidatus Micrarchaeota archaeon]|nr:4-demethylwyosine synthase TYW1 [Candidatus Micrarchaeota archaeon]
MNSVSSNKSSDKSVKKLILSDISRRKFTAATYGFAGTHSGVQICTWTRKALRGKGICYKQKFYGIDCHRCCQMSPALAWCQENCTFCWRPMEWMRFTKMKKKEVDSPEDIISGCVTARRKIMSGIGGAHDANRALFDVSFSKFPSHWAISLSGEPTIYPYLPEMIKLLKSNSEVKSIFLVTNGQEPAMLSQLARKNALPTQLYVSVDAPDEARFKKINKSLYKDGWKRLNRTLALLTKLKCRRVIRFTLIRGINDSEEFFSLYATLFEKSRSDFIEVKGYMFLGASRQRLKFENMPMHEYVREWCKLFAVHLKNYDIINEDYLSRIVLFKRKDSKYSNIIAQK